MSEKSEMEILYEQYSDDARRTYEKDGIVYYKFVHKQKLKLRGGMVLVTVPREAVTNISDSYCDENGKQILFDAPVHMSFRGNGIPRWYIETVTLPVKEISEVSEIGEYVRRG